MVYPYTSCKRNLKAKRATQKVWKGHRSEETREREVRSKPPSGTSAFLPKLFGFFLQCRQPGLWNQLLFLTAMTPRQVWTDLTCSTCARACHIRHKRRQARRRCPCCIQCKCQFLVLPAQPTYFLAKKRQKVEGEVVLSNFPPRFTRKTNARTRERLVNNRRQASVTSHQSVFAFFVFVFAVFK